MNVTIIPPDSRMAIGGVFKTVPLDLPHVNAVRFDGTFGTIEHRPHAGEWQAPRVLTVEEFDAEFGAAVSAWNAAPFDDGTPATTPVLNDVKAVLYGKVDSDAEALRQVYITPGSGQAMTYAEKKEQALAVHGLGEEAANALPNHGVAEFPTLSASVPTEAATLWDAAQLVIARYEAFSEIGGAIERVRIEAKAAIRAAPDEAAARAIYEALTWP